ncbi:Cdc6/Cdc18 family protein [Halomontanus rarus]|uniref:Cdc6/Cdc18 family protein n=1 Tax=Halomontanus rarus TaxID=3034020 RepID=UPI00307C36B0
MITNPRVLEDDTPPQEIVHREGQITHLESVLEPLQRGQRVNGAFIYGPTGAGKTCTAEFLLDELAESADVETHLIDCWPNSTFTAVCRRLLEGLGEVYQPNTPTDELTMQIREAIDKPYVVVLDEADQLADQTILHELHQNPQVTMLLVANRHDEFYSHLDQGVHSRLVNYRDVEFRRYRDDELVAILVDRVESGVRPGAISDARLREIAEAADGDARVAIGILRNALETASARGASTVDHGTVLEVVPSARREILQKTFSKLTRDQRVLYQILVEAGEQRMGEIQAAYRERVDDPSARRTLTRHLKKMAHYDLVGFDGENSARRYWAATDELYPETA